MPPERRQESIFERILRESQERRADQAQRLAQQLARIVSRSRTHGSQAQG